MPNRTPAEPCLICGEITDPMRRGLCTTHYQQFVTVRRKQPKELRAKFEEFLIKKGHLLPKQSRSFKTVFHEAADKYLTNGNGNGNGTAVKPKPGRNSTKKKTKKPKD